MKAALLEEIKKPFCIHEDVSLGDPRPDEVRVRIKHCGICHSDLSVADGGFPSPVPIILGHEAAGIVDALGAGVEHLAVGDQVVLTPCPPCGHCYFCLHNNHSLCVNSSGIHTHTFRDGSTGLSHKGQKVFRGLGVGAFAEYALAPASGAVKIPADVPLDVACVIGCAVQTGVGAVLNTAKVTEGGTVLVTGLGGVGLSVVQGAKLAGASKIIVSDPVAKRREAAKKFGATHLLDPASDDLSSAVMDLTGVGVDYAFETAGVAALIQADFFATRPGGTIVCVGAPPIDQAITIAPAAIFTVMEKKLMGCLLGSSNSLFEIPRLVSLWQAGRLDLEGLITARRPLAQINEAFDDLRNSQGIRTVLSI